MKNIISVKAMIETYIRYGCEQDTWNMFYNMYAHGLITSDNWDKFFAACHDLECIGNIVVNANGEVVYDTDENGCWKKA